MTHETYDEWLAERRQISPPATLANQIMNQVAKLERQRRENLRLRLIQRIEHSRGLRWAVCSGAIAIGSLPFVFLAHVFQL
jgi:hypothetical protein